MALDEALLESAARRGRPVLRFYAWTEPAASFGYSQKFVDIARWTLLRPLVRRPTGGGLVPHDADWTYSLVFPPGHSWLALRAIESYRRVHEWIRDAFSGLNIPTELSPGCRKEAPGRCFAGAEQFDLLWHGKKIAGAAQRRNRFGLLIQASIQPPPINLARSDWQTAMAEAATTNWNVEWTTLEPDSTLTERVAELANLKYSRPVYNVRR